ncbi:alpha-1,3-mannosyl-glycoprotein 2-beta-N-acetylglucosaminyltransferase-like isoform X2 [Dendronephthya gigantea]|uniref:alpha-1,3-mannosyl-glycoprotein 2-beta-N-acetylglucosaminyltransferase-like isoform X2 n=1 Tax=Dendronephthya gigantea TaxID=151771 RepID=UPI0010699565|nr:alpha-1,3-mannosyl-glycoprotein 2-beta-N-acetylglucosaminyltransferase-like isoform X2 [Dendronephthya gigantea]
MRVVRIKHKAGIAVFLVAFVLLLLVLISRHSGPEIHVNNDSPNIPTRTVDFISIAKNVLVRPKNEDKTVQHGLQNTPLSREIKTPRVPKHEVSSYTIGILVIACNRPDAIKRALNSLLKYRPSPKQFPIVVSQDCGHEETSQAISAFATAVNHIKQPDLSEPEVPPNMRRFTGYYKISRHFKWALSQMFDKIGYDTVLIVEDDLDIAPDFYDYFLGTRYLLDEDPTIWCVSAWNDNGKADLVDSNENGKLYRSDFFPGLGWMITKRIWNELRPKWPNGFWDDWMREPAQRKGRVCIRPEICRTKTFGRVGVSQGQFFDQYLKFILLNNKKFDFTHTDLSYLIKEKYDQEFTRKVRNLPAFKVDDIIAHNNGNHQEVQVYYSSESSFNAITSKFGAMVDFKAGVPRAGYQGIVTVMYKGIRVYITHKE